jgi:adenine-specific DNA-methyltransferase
MSIEYLGNKRQLLDFLAPRIVEASRDAGLEGAVVDMFCGMGSVSGAFAAQGWRVHANDHLLLGATMAESVLFGEADSAFEGIADELTDAAPPAQHPSPTPYAHALSVLGQLEPVEGFVWRHYSPASARFEPVERRYFTERNAGRIDAIRARIAAWQPRLTVGEHALLLRSLVEATNAVSNIAGTYGCYLKKYKRRALRELELEPAAAGCGGGEHQVTCADAHAIAPEVSARIAYLDPPYTKRQYAAYYHVLETLVRSDEPPLEGSTGLRPWRQHASDWCYRREAPRALETLLDRLPCEHVWLSYNEDGQIPHDRVMAILEARGRVQLHEVRYPRYKSSRREHKGNTLLERLYHLRRS